MKTWVFTDIHGYAKTLIALFNQILPSKDDLLIFLGDYIDRGPHSMQVIDFIMDLQEQEYKVIALKGNHEEFMQISHEEAKTRRKSIFGTNPPKRKEWYEHGGKETMKSFGLKNPKDIPEKYINWINKLHYYYETDDYVLVHAGLNFKNDNPFEDKHFMLWAKEYEIIPEKINGRKIIHGHTPVSHEFISHCTTSNRQHFICLDNGVYIKKRNGFGNLLAFELTEKLLMAQPAID